MSDPRDAYIKQVVQSKSFVDVGGLWGTVNEKVSVAHAHGARRLTMIDILPAEHALWHLFEDRRRALGLPEVHCISSNIVDLVDTVRCPQFDVVHCSGVLYHMPDPMRFLVALRRITREYLVLSSAITATKIESDPGLLEIPQTATLFIPALQGHESAIVKSYWQKFVGEGAIGLTRKVASWQPDDYSAWWWLPRVEALKAMCIAVGFHYQSGDYMWNDNAYVQLLSTRA